MDNRPIGVFDSGLGGLTAVRELMRLLPAEDIVYFGDTARVPYGGRSPETILKFARQDMNFLCSFDLKAVVIACGTVSTTSTKKPQRGRSRMRQFSARPVHCLCRWWKTAGSLWEIP